MVNLPYWSMKYLLGAGLDACHQGVEVLAVGDDQPGAALPAPGTAIATSAALSERGLRMPKTPATNDFMGIPPLVGISFCWFR
jgi:hypothetical protein